MTRCSPPARVRRGFALLPLALACACGPAAWAAAPADWPEATAVAPDAAGADAVLVWLDAAPGDADAAADRALLSSAEVGAALTPWRTLRLPWPEGSLQDPAGLSRHAAMADAWGVRRLPAWVLLDPEGRVFARFDEGQPLAASPAEAAATLAAALDGLRRRDALLAEADGVQGPEKARLIGAALEEVEPFAVSHHSALIEEALAADPGDASGVRARWWAAWVEPRLERRLAERVFPLIDDARFVDARAALLRVRGEEPLPPAAERKLGVFAAQLSFSAGDAAAARAEVEAVLAETPAGDEADAYRELLASMRGPA